MASPHSCPEIHCPLVVPCRQRRVTPLPIQVARTSWPPRAKPVARFSDTPATAQTWEPTRLRPASCETASFSTKRFCYRTERDGGAAEPSGHRLRCLARLHRAFQAFQNIMRDVNFMFRSRIPGRSDLLGKRGEGLNSLVLKPLRFKGKIGILFRVTGIVA